MPTITKKIYAEIHAPNGDLIWSGWALTIEDAWVGMETRHRNIYNRKMCMLSILKESDHVLGV